MAQRPIFISSDKYPFVEEKLIDFEWHKGLDITQKRKSIRSLHSAVLEQSNDLSLLEISTKSENSLGVKLSAFNLMIKLKSKKDVPLENVFHASKVFKNAGPFKDLLFVPPKEAKSDFRLKESGELIGFFSNGRMWPLVPKTIFYDWLYINTVKRTPTLATDILSFDAFSDIEFNPKRSFNCQARSAALYVSLVRMGKLDLYLSNPDDFLALLGKVSSEINQPVQENLFG
ncbi:DarT1-associated NADAR antitoxin family protein [Aliivibrio salmonicida]|uniref:DarT1-associated NADAR antitoxin family protein n=1 Tax=Aliivibrio salmonicida TaxID=40269 RepID=UPI003D1350A2